MTTPNEVREKLVKQEIDARDALEKEIETLSPEDRAALYYREALPTFERKLQELSKKGMQRVLLAVARRAVDENAIKRVKDPTEKDVLALFDVILGAFFAMFNHSAMSKIEQASKDEANNTILKEDEKNE